MGFAGEGPSPQAGYHARKDSWEMERLRKDVTDHCLAMVEETLSFGDEDDSESAPLGGPSYSGGPPLDERILSVVRRAKKEADGSGLRRITPAHLSSELGLSVEDATRELCGLLAAVGSGAGFVFERVEMPATTAEGESTATNVSGVGTNESAANCANKPGPAATAMVFAFPYDFERLARKSRRSSDWKLASPPSQRRS